MFACGCEKAGIIQNITTKHVENLRLYNCPDRSVLDDVGAFYYHYGIIQKERIIIIDTCGLNDAVNIGNWVNNNAALLSTFNTHQQSTEESGLCAIGTHQISP